MDAINVCSRLEVVSYGLTKSDHFDMHGGIKTIKTSWL